MKTILIAALLFSSDAFEKFARAMGAEMIEVTRKDQDIYEVLGRNLVIKTRYCYEYVYYETAFVHDGTLYFVGDNESCDVEGVYRTR